MPGIALGLGVMSKVQVKFQGSVVGEYPIDEIRARVADGTISPLHKLSTNGSDWYKPSAFLELNAGTLPQSNRAQAAVATPVVELKWFYTSKGSVLGPIPHSEMVAYFKRLEAPAGESVCKEATSVWIPMTAWAAQYKLIKRVKFSKMAIMSFVLAFGWFGGLGSLFGIVFGIVALQNGGKLRGKPFAVIGIIVGALGMILSLVLWIAYVSSSG